MKPTGNPWLKSVWKIVTNPAVELVAAIVLVLLALWLVVSTEAMHRGNLGTVPFMQK